MNDKENNFFKFMFDFDLSDSFEYPSEIELFLDELTSLYIFSRSFTQCSKYDFKSYTIFFLFSFLAFSFSLIRFCIYIIEIYSKVYIKVSFIHSLLVFSSKIFNLEFDNLYREP